MFVDVVFVVIRFVDLWVFNVFCFFGVIFVVSCFGFFCCGLVSSCEGSVFLYVFDS